MAYLRRFLLAWLPLGMTLVAIAAARGDVFELARGGQVQGDWLNREEQPLTQYIVRTTAGLTIKLQPSQVREHRRLQPAEVEYARLAPASPDTVDGHWKLAQWCRERGLLQCRQRHLNRILELDPNHSQTRALLGYGFVNGQWVELASHKRAQGLEFYKSKWRTPQEIELLERDSKREILEKEWLIKLQRWRRMLDSDKARLALDSIRAINDPLAVRPIATLFRRERVRSVKRLYVDVLAHLRTPEAVEFLVHSSLQDPDVEIFHYCLDQLVALQVPRLADEYIDVLKDASNERVNRAAAALARLGDRAAVSPLIEALVTVHQRVLPGKAGLGPDATAATFSADGNSSFSQNNAPHVQIVRVQNQQVLEALTRLSGGAAFGYDQRAWRYWYHQEQQAEARRGTNTLSRQE